MTAKLAERHSTPTPNRSPQDGREHPFRRGACPGLSYPMQTGDGLLVRMLPIGTIALADFVELCRAARAHRNGVIEITARGSIQIRGMNATSAPRFAAAISTLGIATQDGVPILTNALAGIDAEEILDAAALAADLRRAATSLSEQLAPKVSVAVDGGGALKLDEISADVRLSAALMDGATALRVSVGGDDANAAYLGFVAPAHCAETGVRLLELIAVRGRDARARDVLAAEGIAPFQSAMRDLLIPVRPPESRDSELDSRLRGNERTSAIGPHRLRDGSLAYGVGLAFGHADAALLESLAEAAEAAGAGGLRAAPNRALIMLGLTQRTANVFAADAERLGFIVNAHDPRRQVIACAGAPICASAHIGARAMAPGIAAALRDGVSTIHISGCAKGCAYAAPATLTVVGMPDGCGLIANGGTRDAPFAIVPPDQAPAAILRALREARHV